MFLSERMDLSAFPWDFAIIFVFLIAIVPWRGIARVRTLMTRGRVTSAQRVSIYVSTIAMQWLATGITAWRCAVRGLDARSLGVALPNAWVAIGVGVSVALVLGGVQLAGLRAMARVPVDQRGRLYELSRKIMPGNISEAIIFVVLVFTVSACEEFLYRGFMFAVLQNLFRSTIAALLLSSIFFGVGHLYQGRRGMFMTFLLGVIFAMARVYTGSLLPAAIAHFVVDFLAGFAAPGSLAEILRPKGSPAVSAHG
jgi:membrane protease YdiL (CAAX protease family)